MKIKSISTLMIRTFFLLPLLITGCVADVASAFAKESATGAMPKPVHQIEQANKAGIDLSRAMANGKPTLVLFTPVEICQIRYCLQPEQVVHVLDQHYLGEVNLVVAPVYAVDITQKPPLPMIDWPIYLVEPYATWAPEMVQTQFGWGIDAPEITLVNASGLVLYRNSESFILNELADILGLGHHGVQL
ncbi:hypothetical protein KFU94_33735 [Chloroflexi bacterium TSY]|nr:hypothetical protein [Chloroflexi bacterium TSY]